MANILTMVTVSPVAHNASVVLELLPDAGPPDYAVLFLFAVIKDQDGNQRRLELIAQVTNPEANFGGGPSFGRSPYQCLLTTGQGGEFLITITRDDGWPHDFNIEAVAFFDDGTDTAGEVNYTLSDPPSIVITDPGAPIAPTDHIDVTFGGGLAADDVQIAFILGASSLMELGSAYRTEFAYFEGTSRAPYTVQDMNGTLRVTRGAGGWPSSMLVLAAAPSAYVETTHLGVEVFPESIIDPGAVPEVGNLSPAPGQPITTTTPLQFDVTDDSGALRRALVLVAYASGELAGVTELVHDGDAFVGYYSTGCTRDPIAGGFRYTILRNGGWLASPTLRIFAFDRGGNEV